MKVLCEGKSTAMVCLSVMRFFFDAQNKLSNLKKIFARTFVRTTEVFWESLALSLYMHMIVQSDIDKKGVEM